MATLSADRRHEEIARVRSIAANPDAFIRRVQTREKDEKHARQMLDLLSRAFLFEGSDYEGPQLLQGISEALPIAINSYSRRLHPFSVRLFDNKQIALSRARSPHQHFIHQDFHPLPADISLPQAADLLTR